MKRNRLTEAPGYTAVPGTTTRIDWLLLFHLIGALLFFGGACVATVGQVEAMRRRRPSEVALLLGTARLGVALVGLGALMTLVFGSAIVARSGGWSFDETWIGAAYALWLASMVVGAIGGRPARKARELAERLAAEGDAPSAELDRAVRDPLSLVLSLASGAILLALVVLMVWKPGS
jgi:uncharacterized membrane protein